MKCYRSPGAARKAAGGLPYVKVEAIDGKRIYVVPEGDVIDRKLAQVSVLSEGRTTGHVGLGHLDRLGNANHAVATDPISATAFEGPEQ